MTNHKPNKDTLPPVMPHSDWQLAPSPGCAKILTSFLLWALAISALIWGIVLLWTAILRMLA